MNFEKTNVFTIKIRASDDNKLGSLSTDMMMKVSLTDANEAPTIVSNSFVINEATPVGTEIGKMKASDIDAGDVLTYRITAGNDKRHFNIRFKTGIIVITEGLDFESITKYTLSIQVSDIGANTADAKCDILVTNVNEEPYFVTTSDYTRNLDEIEFVQEPEDDKVYCAMPYTPSRRTDLTNVLSKNTDGCVKII